MREFHLDLPRNGTHAWVGDSVIALSADPGTSGVLRAWTPPAWVRLPLLESVLGCPAADITWDVVRSLVERQVAENLCLDYKSTLYGPKSKADELAKDVAAFANASGGLLILGVSEDNQARASGIPGVELADPERLRMIDATLRVAPLVPDLTLGELSNPDNPTCGVYLILVPASAQAPHAAQHETRFSWPVREDRKTRWMREPELASRYRDRFLGRAAQDARLETVAEEGLRALNDGTAGWLTLALTPAKAGRLPTDRDLCRAWRQEQSGSSPWGHVLLAGDVAIGRRRAILSDQVPFTGRSLDHHFELHEDGSGFAAILIPGTRPADGPGQELPTSATWVDIDDVSIWSAGLLDILVRHATHAGASGEFEARAQIVGGHYRGDRSAPLSKIVVEPFNIKGANFGTRRVPASRSLFEPTALRVTVWPGVAGSPRDLIASAADIATGLISEFGAVPSVPLLRADGTVSKDSPKSPKVGSFRDWAELQGIVG